jgi:hypothetical protein
LVAIPIPTTNDIEWDVIMWSIPPNLPRGRFNWDAPSKKAQGRSMRIQFFGCEVLRASLEDFAKGSRNVRLQIFVLMTKKSLFSKTTWFISSHIPQTTVRGHALWYFLCCEENQDLKVDSTKIPYQIYPGPCFFFFLIFTHTA